MGAVFALFAACQRQHNSTCSCRRRSLSSSSTANDYFQKYPKPNNQLLFTRLAGAFNTSWLEQAIQQSILNTGNNPVTYSGYSFCRGAANSAVDAGITREYIKELDRRKSDSVDRYFALKSSNKSALKLTTSFAWFLK